MVRIFHDLENYCEQYIDQFNYTYTLTNTFSSSYIGPKFPHYTTTTTKLNIPTTNLYLSCKRMQLLQKNKNYWTERNLKTAFHQRSELLVVLFVWEGFCLFQEIFRSDNIPVQKFKNWTIVGKNRIITKMSLRFEKIVNY